MNTLCRRGLAVLGRECLVKSFFALQGILKYLHGGLSRPQRLRASFVTRHFWINVFQTEELVICQSQQGLQFLQGQLNTYSCYLDTILPRR